jgi:hypothetical protein
MAATLTLAEALTAGTLAGLVVLSVNCRPVITSSAINY